MGIPSAGTLNFSFIKADVPICCSSYLGSYKHGNEVDVAGFGSNLRDGNTVAVLSSHDYEPYGSALPYRAFNSDKYQFGFNSQEKDFDIIEGLYGAEYWEYDSRTGRRWNVDPVVHASISGYACFLGNPIYFADPSGAEGEPNGGGTTGKPKGGDDVILQSKPEIGEVVCTPKGWLMRVLVKIGVKIANIGEKLAVLGRKTGNIGEKLGNLLNKIEDKMPKLHIWGDESSSEFSLGKKTKKNVSNFDNAELMKIMELVNLGVVEKFKGNPGPKTIDEAAKDFADQALSLKEQRDEEEKKRNAPILHNWTAKDVQTKVENSRQQMNGNNMHPNSIGTLNSYDKDSNLIQFKTNGDTDKVFENKNGIQYFIRSK